MPSAPKFLCYCSACGDGGILRIQRMVEVHIRSDMQLLASAEDEGNINAMELFSGFIEATRNSLWDGPIQDSARNISPNQTQSLSDSETRSSPRASEQLSVPENATNNGKTHVFFLYLLVLTEPSNLSKQF
jgi:hypothetical protein